MISFRVVQSLKGFMKTGIPSANLPPLDPLSLDNVDFSLGGANIEFRNITMAGLSKHDIGDVTYDETKRQISILSNCIFYAAYYSTLKCLRGQDSPP